MINQIIAEIFQEIGEYLDMQDVPFKPRAYEKASEIIASLSFNLGDLYKKGGIAALKEIAGIGESTAEKIEEYLKTGKIKFYEELKKKTPVDLTNLRRVGGLGPKKIKALYKKLDIKNLEELESAAKAGKIKSLEGFGAKSEENILKGIEFLKRSKGRFLYGYLSSEIKKIENDLRKIKGVSRLDIVGSIRRRKETIGDVDILIESKNSAPVMDFFTSMDGVLQVLAKGDTKSAVLLKSGIQVDLRVVDKKSYGAALSYFTGSKDHNVALRKVAIEYGMKLNEYGLYKISDDGEEKYVAGETEGDIYSALKMDYIPPELRENRGEIELARAKKLPKLINYGDLKGDLQTQTNWTDGDASIEEMVNAAIKYGLEYIAITDHTKRLAMTNGLNEKRILEQMKEIDRLNKKLEKEGIKFKILKSTECDILEDGSLDMPDEVLKQLDIVSISVHSLFNLSEKEQTERIKKAMSNLYVNIFFHPTGRRLGKRDPYAVSVPEIIKYAKEKGIVLEINSQPERLDLNDEYIKMCVESGVKMSIDSDAHSIGSFSYLDLGVGLARRGWATKEDIINAWPLEKMLGFLKR